MRQLPGGKRIRRKTLVHQAKRAGRIGIEQFVIEMRRSAAQAADLYKQWCARKTRECRRKFLSSDVGFGDGRFGALANDVELALERVLRRCRRPRRRKTARYRAAKRAPHGRSRSLSIGVSRQPSTVRPSSRVILSRKPSQVQALLPVDRQKAHGDAVLAGRRQRKAEHVLLRAQRTGAGSESECPAPSPVSGSHPQAPRCARFCRICRPFSTMSCEGSPLMLTTKPMPQASCSLAGSYRPWAAGN